MSGHHGPAADARGSIGSIDSLYIRARSHVPSDGFAPERHATGGKLDDFSMVMLVLWPSSVDVGLGLCSAAMHCAKSKG
jgi:hypothetical protein